MTAGPRRRSPLEEILDLTIFVPLGVVATLNDDMARVAARGRAAFEGQVTMAGVVGRFAIAEGARRAGSVMSELRSRAGGLFDASRGCSPARTSPESSAPASPPGASGEPLAPESGAVPSSETQTPPRPGVPERRPPGAPPAPSGPGAPPMAPRPTGVPGAPGASPSAAGQGLRSAPTRPARRGVVTSSGPGVTSLGIPGYDELSAVQVIQRLASLSDSELRLVLAYEAAHRGRRTIIGRVRQLLGDETPGG